MKNLLFSLLAFVALVTLPLQAQQPKREGGTPEEMAKRQTERMKKSLELTDQQSVKVSEINLKFIKKQAEVRKDAGEDRTAMREAMVKIRKERQAELKGAMSDAQYQKMLEQEKEMMQNKGQGRGQRSQGQGKK